MELKMIPAHEVASIWPKAEMFLVPAMGATSPSGYSARDIFDMLECDELILAVAMEGGEVYGAACLQLIDYPRLKRCRVRLIGGREMHRWLHLIPQVESWATKQGCSEIIIEGRNGWERRLPSWEKRAVIMGKRLDHALV
jgi:hypothetical protein